MEPQLLTKNRIQLDDVTAPETFEVDQVCGKFCARLMEMGIVPGATLTFVRSAPLRFPIEIEVNGLLLVLRREEASGVWLKN